MDTMGERLKYVRKKLKMTQVDVAHGTDGVTSATVNRIEKNLVEPHAHVVLKISRCLGVNLQWLLTGEGPMEVARFPKYTQEEIQLLQRLYRLDEEGKGLLLNLLQGLEGMAADGGGEVAPRQVRMRVYDVRVSAGLGFYLDNESTYEMLHFNEDEVPDHADFAMRISGESMAPTIGDNDIVWIKSMPVVENRQIGIFILNNELLCKEFRIDYRENKIQLISHNPAYKPLDITEDDAFGTVGKVL